jgi:hypothetical protein
MEFFLVLGRIRRLILEIWKKRVLRLDYGMKGEKGEKFREFGGRCLDY